MLLNIDFNNVTQKIKLGTPQENLRVQGDWGYIYAADVFKNMQL